MKILNKGFLCQDLTISNNSLNEYLYANDYNGNFIYFIEKSHRKKVNDKIFIAKYDLDKKKLIRKIDVTDFLKHQFPCKSETKPYNSDYCKVYTFLISSKNNIAFGTLGNKSILSVYDFNLNKVRELELKFDSVAINFFNNPISGFYFSNDTIILNSSAGVLIIKDGIVKLFKENAFVDITTSILYTKKENNNNFEIYKGDSLIIKMNFMPIYCSVINKDVIMYDTYSRSNYIYEIDLENKKINLTEIKLYKDCVRMEFHPYKIGLFAEFHFNNDNSSCGSVLIPMQK